MYIGQATGVHLPENPGSPRIREGGEAVLETALKAVTTGGVSASSQVMGSQSAATGNPIINIASLSELLDLLPDRNGMEAGVIFWDIDNCLLMWDSKTIYSETFYKWFDNYLFAKFGAKKSSHFNFFDMLRKLDGKVELRDENLAEILKQLQAKNWEFRTLTSRPEKEREKTLAQFQKLGIGSFFPSENCLFQAKKGDTRISNKKEGLLCHFGNKPLPRCIAFVDDTEKYCAQMKKGIDEDLSIRRQVTSFFNFYYPDSNVSNELKPAQLEIVGAFARENGLNIPITDSDMAFRAVRLIAQIRQAPFENETHVDAFVDFEIPLIKEKFPKADLSGVDFSNGKSVYGALKTAGYNKEAIAQGMRDVLMPTLLVPLPYLRAPKEEPGLSNRCWDAAAKAFNAAFGCCFKKKAKTA